MAVILASSFVALDADAPAAAGTWASPWIPIRQEGAFGAVARATVLDLYVFHQGQNFDYRIDGSDDGATPFVMSQSLGIAGHSAGGLGTLVQGLRVPSAWVRVRVTNVGAAPAAAFRVFGSLSVS